MEAVFIENKKIEKKLIHTFLGHLGPLRRTLTGLEARISLVNDIESALTLDDLAVSVAAFGGSE